MSGANTRRRRSSDKRMITYCSETEYTDGYIKEIRKVSHSTAPTETLEKLKCGTTQETNNIYKITVLNFQELLPIQFCDPVVQLSGCRWQV